MQPLNAELQCPSLVMDEEVLKRAHRGCGIIELMSAQRCRDVIRLAERRPVLRAYMSDGWSVDMRTRTAAGHDGDRFVRSGRRRTEYEGAL